MCGIIAALSAGSDVTHHIVRGLRQLQNRGYDSSGIASIKSGKVVRTREVTDDSSGAVDKLAVVAEVGSLAIGHTRWATHGPKTRENAHPHFDSTGRFAIVHNGIIENHGKIRERLQSEGYSFTSSTDSEVIANLLSLYARELDTKSALEKTCHDLQGTWGIVAIDRESPGSLYCTRKGSPLLVSCTPTLCIISSEESGFDGSCINYVCLDDDDIFVAHLCNNEIRGTTSTRSFEHYDSVGVSLQDLSLDLGPYSHWMEKEILEQEHTVFRTLAMGGRLHRDGAKLGGLECSERLRNISHLILLGCGTSYHSIMTAKIAFENLCTFDTIQGLDASEFRSSSLPRKGKICAILVSQSGETRDLVKHVSLLRSMDIPMVGVVNVVGSLVARSVDCGVYLNAGREVAVASTKAFTSQVVALHLLVMWFSEKQQSALGGRRRLVADCRRLSGDLSSVLTMWDRAEDIARLLRTCTSCFVLGRGSTLAVAQEGALKIKEVSGIHAEGFSSSALKHGPFSLLGPEFPSILVMEPEDEVMVSNSHEIRARGSPLFSICYGETNAKEGSVALPANRSFFPLLAGVFLQMVAYRTCVLRGLNPDFPKNLAKVVTTD